MPLFRLLVGDRVTFAILLAIIVYRPLQWSLATLLAIVSGTLWLVAAID